MTPPKIHFLPSGINGTYDALTEHFQQGLLTKPEDLASLRRIADYYGDTELIESLDDSLAEEHEERFEVTVTSDAFPDPQDAFAIWDNANEEYYAETDGTVLTYSTEEEAQEGLLKIRKAELEKKSPVSKKKKGKEQESCSER